MESERSNFKDYTLPLKRITPLSKYLALILFIVLPFLGGWVGYNYGVVNHLKIKEVVNSYEEEKPMQRLVKNITVTNEIFLSDDLLLQMYPCSISEIYHSYLDKDCYRILKQSDDTVLVENIASNYKEAVISLDLIYIEPDKNSIIFKAYYAKSGALIVSYSWDKNEFKNISDFDPAAGDVLNANFLASAKSSKSIEIFDLSKNNLIETITLEDGETLNTTNCTIGGEPEGYVYSNLLWSDNRLLYGVYKEDVYSDCESEFIEFRTFKVN